MRTRLLAKQLHLLLASITLGAGAACGGSLATIDDGQSADGGGPKKQADAAGGGDDGSVVTTDSDASSTDSGHADAGRQLDAGTPDVFSGCATGLINPDPALCCATQNPPAPECGNAGGDNGTQCALDCRAVCERVAPGSSSSTGFLGCYWSASATDPQIGYACGQCGVGRIPNDTAPCPPGASVAERLAAQAYYEAASVIAFDRLVSELERRGAPRRLIERAHAASADEKRHAALFERLAEQRGASVVRPARREAQGSLLDLALENATEGCVRETYGALVALYQALHARDAELRAAFARVAEDEIAHAALSLDLAEWFDVQLSTGERERVRSARSSAERALAAALTEDADDIGRLLGLPSAEVAELLFARLFGEVLPAMQAAA